MSWLQLSITVERATAPAMEELLLALGATSVTLQDNLDNPVLEPGVGETPLWPEVKVSALFEESIDRQALLDTLFASCNDASLFPRAIDRRTFDKLVHTEALADRDWEREWLNHFEPVQCGEHLWICPGWYKPPDPQAVNVMLDPGLAFGTGTHETTLLCLRWLDGLDLENKSVLDFGCGSGILGIAALLLGASHASFVDNDPQALQATRSNLEKNGIDNSQFTIYSPAEFSAFNASYDVVLANILAKPLIELSDQLSRATRPGGWLTLSGLQPPQEESVRSAYATHIQLGERAELNGWLRLTGRAGNPGRDSQ